MDSGLLLLQCSESEKEIEIYLKTLKKKTLQFVYILEIIIIIKLIIIIIILKYYYIKIVKGIQGYYIDFTDEILSGISSYSQM